jgi:hypothetical protein
VIAPARSAYFAAYLEANRPRIYARAAEFRRTNLARTKAHDRLRYLRSKAELTPGEIEQCAEIVKQYPKRRIVYGPS